MKKKVLSLALALLMVLSLLPVSAFADEHDLKVYKDAACTTPAVEGSDYSWNTFLLTIKQNGLTVTGTSSGEVIKMDMGVTSLTLKDVSISYGMYNVFECSSDSTVTLLGNNTFVATGMVNYAISTSVNAVTFSGTGTLTATASTGVTISCGAFTVLNTVNKIIVTNPFQVPIKCSGFSIPDNYEIIGSTDISVTDETNMEELTFDDDGYFMIGEDLPAIAVIRPIPHKHSLTKVEAGTEATCTTDGAKQDYWVCTGEGGCGTYFSDDDGKNEIAEASKADYVIPALGHSFTGDAVSNGNDTHSFKCKNSGCNAVGTMNDTMPVEYEEGTKGFVTCSGGTATCTEAAVCSVCVSSYGEVDSTAHIYAKEWTTDDTHHWHAATCAHTDNKSDLGEHAEGDVIDYKCDVCGYDFLEACKTSNKGVAGEWKTNAISDEAKALADAAIEAIDEAATVEAINGIMAALEAAMAAADKALVDARAEAIKEIEETAGDPAKLSEKIQKIIKELEDEINAATNLPQVKELLAEAKSAITLGSYQDAAIKEILAAAGKDDSKAMKKLLEKAINDIDDCENEGQVDIMKSIYLKDVAKQLVRDSSFNVIFGGEGGLVGLLTSFFQKDFLEELSQFNLAKGIIKVVVSIFG